MNPLARYSHPRLPFIGVLALIAAIVLGLANPSRNDVLLAPDLSVGTVPLAGGNGANDSAPIGVRKGAPRNVSIAARGSLENGTGESDLRVARSGSEFGGNDFPVTVVPRRIAGTIPSHLQTLESTAERKHVFITSMLPLILLVNETIAANRRDLLALRERLAADGMGLTPRDRFWLARIRARYGAANLDFDSLLLHVDVVPPSLALAQAAEESGWGTSRYAREGNAVFGQYTYRQGRGLVPRRRDGGERHEVRAFGALVDSVAAYVLNLNSHHAYREFRAKRATLRAQRQNLDGMVLAGTLRRYSERGEEYINSVRSIIRDNELMRFDRSRLVDEDIVTTPKTPPV